MEIAQLSSDFGFIFALGLVSFIVRIWWPAGWIFQLLNVPVGYLPQYISFYILGIIAYRHNWFSELTPKMGTHLVADCSTCYFHLRMPGISLDDASFGCSRKPTD